MMSGFLSRSVKFFLCEKELAISHAILSHESLGWGFVYYCCGVVWRRKRLLQGKSTCNDAKYCHIICDFPLPIDATGDVLLLCTLKQLTTFCPKSKIKP